MWHVRFFLLFLMGTIANAFTRECVNFTGCMQHEHIQCATGGVGRGRAIFPCCNAQSQPRTLLLRAGLDEALHSIHRPAAASLSANDGWLTSQVVCLHRRAETAQQLRSETMNASPPRPVGSHNLTDLPSCAVRVDGAPGCGAAW